jgi:hypothetical protein
MSKGLKPGPAPKVGPEIVERIKALRAGGLVVSAICKETARFRSSVNRTPFDRSSAHGLLIALVSRESQSNPKWRVKIQPDK